MGKYFKYSVSPTIGLAVYADGDYDGTVMTVKTGAADTDSAKLKALTIVDNAAQKGPFNIIFFSEAPTMTSADNAALSLADGYAANYIGHVTVAATDYVDSALNAMACLKDINLDGLASTDVSGTIYAILESKGTPDYVATDDLTFTFTFEL